MIPDSFVITAFVGVVISEFTLHIMQVMGAGMYDMRQVRLYKQQREHPRARRFSNKPVVSVIVLTRNAEKTIDSTLQSLLASSYRKLEIVVVDEASTDQTKTLVKQFIRNYQKKTIKLCARHKQSTELLDIQAGLKKTNGELIMPLRAGSLIEKHTVRNAVRHFALDDIHILIPALVTIQQPTLKSLLQRFTQIINNRPKKLYSVLHALPPKFGVGTIYQRSIDAHSPKVSYATDVVVVTPSARYHQLFAAAWRPHKEQRSGPQRAKRSWLIWPLVIWKQLLELLKPLLISYALYLAVALHRPLLYGLLWGSLTFLLVLVIWSDERLNIAQKSLFSLYAPVLFQAYYLLSCIRFLGIISFLLPKKQTRRRATTVKRHSKLLVMGASESL